MIKGASGAGKTMFALQLAYELRDLFIPVYVSPRVSYESLVRQFPLTASAILRKQTPHAKAQEPPPSPSIVTCPSCGASIEVVMGEGALEATCPVCGRTQRFANRTKLNQLTEKIQHGEHPLTPQYDLPEIEAAYDAADENFARYPQLRTLLLIDPIDALDEDYEVRVSKLVNVLQRDLVENSDAGVVYVVSGVGLPRIDALVDGLMTLSAARVTSPTLRVLRIEKLRGREVQRREYFLRIHEGRLWEMAQDLLQRLTGG